MKETLLAQLDLAQEYFDRSTGSLTEEDSAFAPAEGLLTVAQHVAHAAHTIDWFFAGALRPERRGRRHAPRKTVDNAHAGIDWDILLQ